MALNFAWRQASGSVMMRLPCGARGREHRAARGRRLDLSSSPSDSSSRSLDCGCGNASFLCVTPAFPDSLFSLTVAPAHPHYEEQTSGALGMARRPKVVCPWRVESLPSARNGLLRSGVMGEGEVAAGMHRDTNVILCNRACSETRKSLMRPRTNMAACSEILIIPLSGRRIQGSGKGPSQGWLPQLLLPFSAFFCLLLWEPWP